VAFALNLAGMAKATGNKNVPKEATYIYSLRWLAGAIVAFVIYTIAGRIWPMEEQFEVGQVMDDLHASSLNHSDQDDRKVAAQDTAKGYQLCAAHELNRDEGK
jgi:NCS1 family nucleobase:cation symporter-1